MGKIIVGNQTEPATPSSGQTVIYIDSADRKAKQKDDTGTVIDLTTGIAGPLHNVVIENFDCDASVAIGNAVRISGSIAVNAQADSLANSHFIGIVESKSTSILCDIRLNGVTPEIFGGLSVSSPYFLDAAVPGQLITTPPTGSGEVVVRVGQPLNATQMILMRGIPLVRA